MVITRTSNSLPAAQGGCENLPGLPTRGGDPAGRAPVRSTQGSAVTTLGSDPVRVHRIAPSPRRREEVGRREEREKGRETETERETERQGNRERPADTHMHARTHSTHKSTERELAAERE